MEQRNNRELQEAQEESIRLMQEYADNEQDNQTTEARLMDVRRSMRFTKASKTIRRTGWYFTEAYAPCGYKVGA